MEDNMDKGVLCRVNGGQKRGELLSLLYSMCDRQQFQDLHIQVYKVVNDRLQTRFADKKAKMAALGYTEADLKVRPALSLHTSDVLHVCEKGPRTGQQTDSLIAPRALGVTLITKLHTLPPTTSCLTVVVYQYIAGYQTQVLDTDYEWLSTWPDRSYDSYVSSRHGQVYLYDYACDGAILEYPRHVYPVAVLKVLPDMSVPNQLGQSTCSENQEKTASFNTDSMLPDLVHSNPVPPDILPHTCRHVSVDPETSHSESDHLLTALVVNKKADHLLSSKQARCFPRRHMPPLSDRFDQLDCHLQTTQQHTYVHDLRSHADDDLLNADNELQVQAKKARYVHETVMGVPQRRKKSVIEPKCVAKKETQAKNLFDPICATDSSGQGETLNNQSVANSESGWDVVAWNSSIASCHTMERWKKCLFEGLYVADPRGKFQNRTLLKGKGVPARFIPLDALYTLHPIKPSGRAEVVPVDPRIAHYTTVKRLVAQRLIEDKLTTLTGILEMRKQLEVPATSVQTADPHILSQSINLDVVDMDID